MNDKLFRKNFIWNTLGSFLFGFTSLIYMIIVSRINGIDDAGIFTYCFSLASIMCTIGSYSGKTYQITETDERFNDMDYIYTRIFTCIIMIIASILVGIVFRFNSKKFLILFLLTIYRSIDAFIEVFHATLQRNNKLYVVGESLFFKTLVLIFIFFIIDKFTNNIVLASLSLIIIDLIFCLLFDFRIAKKFILFEKIKLKNTKLLLKMGFSMFMYCFLSQYAINIPKYIIDLISTDAVQGIYGIIIMPASFLAMVSQYITQPFLNDITDKVKNNNYNGLEKIAKKLVLCILGIGILALICCYILGIPFLEFIYNIDLSSEKISLMIVIVGSIFYSIIIFFSAILVAMRKINIQTIFLIVASVLSLGVSYTLVRKYTIIGATISYLILMLFLFIMYLIAVVKNIKGGMIKNEKI